MRVPPSVFQANQIGHIQLNLQQPRLRNLNFQAAEQYQWNWGCNCGFTCKGSWYVASSVVHPILSLIVMMMMMFMVMMMTMTMTMITMITAMTVTLMMMTMMIQNISCSPSDSKNWAKQVNFQKLGQLVIARDCKNYLCKQHLNWWRLAFNLVFALASVSKGDFDKDHINTRQTMKYIKSKMSKEQKGSYLISTWIIQRAENTNFENVKKQKIATEYPKSRKYQLYFLMII